MAITISMPKVLKHFGKICQHKWWVFYYCCQAGIPWRGIKHDMSKFSPTEFWESVRYYQGTSSPIDAAKKDKGWSAAWMHHKGRNSHHYEYFIDNLDNGGTALQMPFQDALELICDYLGAARAYLGKEFSFKKEWEWWLNKSNKPLFMHPHTKAFITLALWHLQDNEPQFGKSVLYLLKKENMRRYYDDAYNQTFQDKS